MKRGDRFFAQQRAARTLECVGLQLAAQHHFDQLNLRQLAGFPAADKAAVAQHRNTVAHLVNLIEEVRNKDQAHALIAQLAHQGKKHLHFLGIEAGGGFIEDQHFRREIDSATDRHDLLHRHGKTVQRFAHVEREAIRFHQLRGARFHLFAAQQAKTSGLAANKQVIRYRHVWQQVHFLVDRADPQLLRMRGVFGRNSITFQPDSAAIGVIDPGQGFNQRRLPRPVFAEQRHDLPPPQAEINVIQRLNAREKFTQALCAEDFLVLFGGHGFPSP